MVKIHNVWIAGDVLDLTEIQILVKLKNISNKSKEYIKTRNELRSLKKNNQLAWLEIQ